MAPPPIYMRTTTKVPSDAKIRTPCEIHFRFPRVMSGRLMSARNLAPEIRTVAGAASTRLIRPFIFIISEPPLRRNRKRVILFDCAGEIFSSFFDFLWLLAA